MKETKIFLTEEEDKTLIEVAKEAGQSKVKFCTHEIKKVLNKSKAKKLAESQKKIDSDVNFRIVKLVETYDVGAWF